MKLLKLIIQQACFALALVIRFVFSIFPIKKNKIFLYSYRGNKFACNQRAFVEYLLSNGDEKLEVVCGYANENTGDMIPKGVKKVRMRSIHYFYELYTSHFVCTNQRVSFFDFFIKRKNQIYIHTWHASAWLKKAERDAEDTLSKVYLNEAKRDSKMIDIIISGSRQMSDFYKNSFWYDGPLLEIGTMRNDVLFNINQEKITMLKEKYNLPLDKKIILYAPTFRNSEGKLSTSYDYGMNYEEISKSFSQKLGDNIILIKQHPNLRDHKQADTKYSRDVTEIDDIQELLVASDVLITDYSSVMFDFILMNKPLFLFATDYGMYDRGLSSILTELPVSVSKNNKELSINIINFDDVEYTKKILEFEKKYIGSFEKGTASQQLYDYILSNIDK